MFDILEVMITFTPSLLRIKSSLLDMKFVLLEIRTLLSLIESSMFELESLMFNIESSVLDMDSPVFDHESFMIGLQSTSHLHHRTLCHFGLTMLQTRRKMFPLEPVLRRMFKRLCESREQRKHEDEGRMVASVRKPLKSTGVPEFR